MCPSGFDGDQTQLCEMHVPHYRVYQRYSDQFIYGRMFTKEVLIFQKARTSASLHCSSVFCAAWASFWDVNVLCKVQFASLVSTPRHSWSWWVSHALLSEWVSTNNRPHASMNTIPVCTDLTPALTAPTHSDRVHHKGSVKCVKHQCQKGTMLWPLTCFCWRLLLSIWFHVFSLYLIRHTKEWKKQFCTKVHTLLRAPT